MPVLRLQSDRPPRWWPRFTSTLRSTAITARVGRMLGGCFAICFVTGMLSHYQYHPFGWLPEPSSPVWGYRLTQGLHVLTGIAAIPLLLVKLWSVFPRLFQWPLITGARNALERLSIAVLVSSTLVELFTGLFNSLDWYPWPWHFVPIHRFLGYVVIGSVLLHVAIKLPDIRRGLATPLTPSGEPDELAPSGISRRGVLIATATGVGAVVATTVGQTVTPLAPIGLFAIRRSEDGPQRVPVNRTAGQAGVSSRALDPRWELHVDGPHPYVMSRVEIEAAAVHGAHLPIACVEGWSVGAQWRGLRLLDLVRRAGGDEASAVRVTSLERVGSYNHSFVDGPQLGRALLATHLNGSRLDVDHGYPLRLIAPDRAGVLNTKWLSRVEIL